MDQHEGVAQGAHAPVAAGARAAAGSRMKGVVAQAGSWLATALGLLLVGLVMLPVVPVWLAWVLWRMRRPCLPG